MIDFSKITDVEVDGVDMSDYPDFCDAFIQACKIDGKPATDEELEEIADNDDFVYEQVLKTIY